MQDQPTRRAVFVTEPKWRFFVSLVGFALFYLLDQAVRLFIGWYVGSESPVVLASHPMHALGELSRVVCGLLAMAVVLIVLLGVSPSGRRPDSQGDLDN